MGLNRNSKEHLMNEMKKAKDWISNAIKPSNKGKLHKALNVPGDKKIPEKKLKKAEHSSNPKIKKMANLAATLKDFKHKK